MSHRIITEDRLDHWAGGNSRAAQGVVVELVSRLIAASSPRPRAKRFPLGDSIGQHGPDGFLVTDTPLDPYVPNGTSYWEIGTGDNAQAKATKDYRSLTRSTPAIERQAATFVFVTPRSGRRVWKYTWAVDAQRRWLATRNARADWSDVRVIDGTILVDWLMEFPAVERWLAREMQLPVDVIQTLDQRWADLRSIGQSPALTPDVFLANRVAASEHLDKVLAGTATQLQLDTRFPNEVADFVAAHVEAMEVDAKMDARGRCLIVPDLASWGVLDLLTRPHVLVADFDVSESDSPVSPFLERACQAGHSLIYSGRIGGIPNSHRVRLPHPDKYQLEEALKKSGFSDERARVFAQRSGGDLGTLRRCLQNLPTLPGWSLGTDAVELSIASLLGSWNERDDGDKVIVEAVASSSYQDWIATMRRVSQQPGSPLSQRDGLWKFRGRYEAWHALGPQLFDEHLERFRECAISVLGEVDPKFELEKDQRFAASFYGTKLSRSKALRKGIAEGVALLGTHPNALTSCSREKARVTAVRIVRQLLEGADWIRWSSLDRLLPLLAEAAPTEYLAAVEASLGADPCPFARAFQEESDGLFGGLGLSGLLWGLESLAWDPKLFTRSVMALGELAAIEPGAKWSDRPANSLIQILLPWLPQTCAPTTTKLAAVELLLREVPSAGWKLLLKLLPGSHRVSHHTHKPSWRETIPSDWTERVTPEAYWQEVEAYADMAVEAAKLNPSRLLEIIAPLHHLPPTSRERLLGHLRSDGVRSIDSEARLRLSNEIGEFVRRHRKFAQQDWALSSIETDELASIAETLAPSGPEYRHRRLFNGRDWDLIDGEDYAVGSRILDQQRKDAVEELFSSGALTAVLAFAQVVEAPVSVGFASRVLASTDVGAAILPALLDSKLEALSEFARGFVAGILRDDGWPRVDGLEMSLWTQDQRATLLTFCPFNHDTWDRATALLGDDNSLYWSRTPVNPHSADHGLDYASVQLLDSNRPLDALQCLARLALENQPIDAALAIRVLNALLDPSVDPKKLDGHRIVKVVQALQNDPQADWDAVSHVEWSFLPLLDDDVGASPRCLEHRLAEEPALFCELLGAVFWSSKEEARPPLTSEQLGFAKNARDLLEGWSIPPGTARDGAFQGGRFDEWLATVKSMCAASGHSEHALATLAHVLTRGPADPDGLWIHASIAAALNAKDAGRMRKEFCIALYNARGMHACTEGQEEKRLAEEYGRKAKEVEDRGFHRFATSLRELADSYARESAAAADSSDDPFDR